MLHRWGAPQLLKSSQTIYSGPSLGSHVISEELHTPLWKSGPIPVHWPYLPFLLWVNSQHAQLWWLFGKQAQQNSWKWCQCDQRMLVLYNRLSTFQDVKELSCAEANDSVWLQTHALFCAMKPSCKYGKWNESQAEALPGTASPTSPSKITHKFEPSKSALSRSSSRLYQAPQSGTESGLVHRSTK